MILSKHGLLLQKGIPEKAGKSTLNNSFNCNLKFSLERIEVEESMYNLRRRASSEDIHNVGC